MSAQTNQGGQSQPPEKTKLLKASGRRPQFHALWHLFELGVVDDGNTFESSKWEAVRKSINEEGKPRVRVAIIDTLPAFTHPNLVEQIDMEKFRDFSNPGVVKDKKHLPEDDSPDLKFGAHGTSVAGLIVARPRHPILLQRPVDLVGKEGTNIGLGDDLPEPLGIDLPYCGINPCAMLVPLVVSAAPDAAMIQAALEHATGLALKNEIDIVVIADSWDRDGTPYPDSPPSSAAQDGLSVGYGSKIEKSPPVPRCPPAKTPWQIVDEKLDDLCRAAFVFCAAGNEPRSPAAAKDALLVYPASASKRDRGPWAVGACDFEGRDLTYTPNSVAARSKGHRLITTLSSEHPRLDNDTQRLDPWAKLNEELNFPDWLFTDDWPGQDIVSTDVPGPAGYNPSPYDHVPAENRVERGCEKIDTHLEIASLYCRFSGTSAATAIAAGLVSLALALERAGEVPEDRSGNPYQGEDGLFTLGQATKLVQMKLPRWADQPEK